MKKTIYEYMHSNRLEIGDCVYSYVLGKLYKFKLMEIVKSEYNNEEYALLKLLAFKSYTNKKWQVLNGYEEQHTWLRANVYYDSRFDPNPISCLKNAMESLEKHIESSKWQLEKAEILLKC